MATSNPFAKGNTPKPAGVAKSAEVPKSTEAPLPGSNSSINNDMFEVDLSEVQSGFIIPDSLYMVRCVDMDQGVSQSGNPQYIWSFVITQGEYEGREFRMYTAITPAALWKVAEVVKALGVGETGKVVRFRRSDVVGKECVAVIESSEYKGQSRSSIVRVMTLEEAQEQ